MKSLVLCMHSTLRAKEVNCMFFLETSVFSWGSGVEVACTECSLVSKLFFGILRCGAVQFLFVSRLISFVGFCV